MDTCIQAGYLCENDATELISGYENGATASSGIILQ